MSHRIEILTAPDSHLLVDLNAVKVQLDISDSSQDDLLDQLIAGASAVIESYLGRPILSQEVRETWRQMSWKQRDSLVTSYAPILSLESVTENQVDLLENTDFEVEYPTGVFYRTSDGFRYRWGHEIKIDYFTGYDTVPTVISQVCTDLVGYAYHQTQMNPAIQMEMTEGVGRTAYFARSNANFALDDTMKLILQPYQAIIP
jgi:Phage gp6-like head-tail connector protein